MQGREEMGEIAWTTTATERVMMAFDSRPHSQELLRDGCRLARGLKAPLLAVTVVLPHRFLAPSQPSEAALKEQIRLAEDLGAEVIRVEGHDIAAT
jgi:K+-sensing histidine kinase KdpD